MEQDIRWMREALARAEQAEAAGEVPVGAVVVLDGKLIGEGWNQPISASDPTAHAEVMALRDAARRAGNYRLPGATLYVTIEPCTMCTGALVHSRIARLVFGAREPKGGVVASNAHLLDARWFNHRLEVREGVLAAECASRVSAFFARKRQASRRKER